MFKGKRKPVILTVQQLQDLIKQHPWAGWYELKGVHYTMCGCGRSITGPLEKHQAEEIAKLQV